MIKFVQNIKDVFNISHRIRFLESELSELETKLENSVRKHSKQFEKKIQAMTFAYTNNLDDTKSNYLKQYVETRINCMQNSIPKTILALQANL